MCSWHYHCTVKLEKGQPGRGGAESQEGSSRDCKGVLLAKIGYVFAALCAAVSRRQRASRDNDGQRARTDWQKRDEYTWIKVVPPWWAEHKTVHFASEWASARFL
jgi:hypothetical protein